LRRIVAPATTVEDEEIGEQARPRRLIGVGGWGYRTYVFVVRSILGQSGTKALELGTVTQLQFSSIQSLEE
jgi:hypothetical protein